MDTSRRSAIAGIIGFAGLGAVPGLAQRVLAAPPPDRIIRVGMLTSGAPVRWNMVESATAAGLRDLGYIEGKNLELIRRSATYPDPRMDAYARELIDGGVDVIVTSCGWSTRVASQMTTRIPIVIGSIVSPVERGFIRSLSRPGTNLTGQTGHIPQLAPKMLEYLRIALPGATTIGALGNPKNPTHATSFQSLEAAGKQANLKVIHVDLYRLSTAQGMRVLVRDLGVHALIVQPDDDLFFEMLEQIFLAAAELRVPTFFTKRDLVDVGGVFSYGADSVDIFRRNAWFIDRIVNGASPAEMPVEHPTKLEFAINLKKAHELGIEIPRAALMRAHYVVR